MTQPSVFIVRNRVGLPSKVIPILLLFSLLLMGTTALFADKQRISHAPLRPLPQPSNREAATGPTYFVDVQKGSDKNDGSSKQPWQTINHAVAYLKPGDTLYLRDGIYYENVYLASIGRKDAPITVRSYPGELAVIDGGLREFYEAPVTCWEPFPQGAENEYRSTKPYRNIRNVLGAFDDSMIGLQPYHHATDLRAKNELWIASKGEKLAPIYCGPGLWYNRETARIHIRLGHTHHVALGGKNYRGETDPRKLPLIISPFNSLPLLIDGAEHLRLQDIVIRGAGFNTTFIRRGKNIDLDNVTFYCGTHGLRVETTGHLKIHNCAFRGQIPPWAFRSEFKYSYWGENNPRDVVRLTGMILLLPEEGKMYKYPQNHDWEITNCEFTDGHDGPYVGGVFGLKFHHNLVDKMHDDGIYLSAWGHPGGDVHIYQNRLADCLTMFAFGLGKGAEADPGTGTYIYRNIIDLRGPVHYRHPSPTSPPRIEMTGRLCADHGGPIWEPMFIYHNTVIAKTGRYALGWAGHTRGTKRRVFNNIFVHTQGMPGMLFPTPNDDFHIDGNLSWSTSDGDAFDGDVFSRLRKSGLFETSQKQYPPGWEASGIFANPKFVQLSADYRVQNDYRLQQDSPAIDAGVPLPSDWPDVKTMRSADKAKPDIGAIPAGDAIFQVGRRR